MSGWLKRLLGGALMLALPALASAQTLPIALITGPQDVSQLNSTLNGIINKLNSVLGAGFVMQAGDVNFITLNAAPTGQLAEITVGGATPDANSGIGIAPNGSGNIVLFAPSSLTTTSGTGLLQFANNASFVPATGLATCPGVAPNKDPVLGAQDHIVGYLVWLDWLNVKHATPSC